MSTRDLTAWVCSDCYAAIGGVTSDLAGRPMPIPFDGDRTVLRSVNGSTDPCPHSDVDWHEWPEVYHDQHAEQCETRELSTYPCESCRDHHHGTRHAVTITVST